MHIKNATLFSVGDTVLITNNTDHCPGMVTAIQLFEIQVKFMQNVGRNQWIWPVRENRKWCNFKDVKQLLPSLLCAVGTSKRVSHYQLLDK